MDEEGTDTQRNTDAFLEKLFMQGKTKYFEELKKAGGFESEDELNEAFIEWKNDNLHKILEHLRYNSVPVAAASKKNEVVQQYVEPKQSDTETDVFQRNQVRKKASQLFLPDLDRNLAAGQFITAEVKRPAVAPPPVPSKRNERLNVGIYLDENFANVGTCLINDANEVDLILQMPAEIVFMEDEVVVGWQAEKNRNSLNHFYLYQLIKNKASEVHPVHFKTIKHAPCTEEIIAIFFKKLHQNISLLKRGTFVNSVIITIPFTLTSAEKERIKTAARISGLPNVRVLSSLATMAIAYARETQFYLMDRLKEKTILVIHYLAHSFSMAILEISQNSIITRRCFGSENMPEGKQVAFLSSHDVMFRNGTLNQKQDIYILNIYKRALHELSSGTSASWDRIIIVKEQQTTKLDKILDNLFGKQNQSRGYLDGPLLGACLLA
ncbi:unnamed protein product, partial [Allacma fusca]